MRKKRKWFNGLTYGMIFLLGIMMLLNQFLTIQMMRVIVSPSVYALELTGDPNVDAGLLIFSAGIPEIYGEELGITYPDPRNTQYMNRMIKDLGEFDRGSSAITLTGKDLQRYIRLGTIPTIACEFCCNAETLIFDNGQTACSCAHSSAMRGLMRYLILNHGSEYTDEEILNEVIKWKALTFPKQMMQRYVKQAVTGEFTPDMAALLVNTGISKRAKKNVPSPLDLNNLPDMSGGC